MLQISSVSNCNKSVSSPLGDLGRPGSVLDHRDDANCTIPIFVTISIPHQRQRSSLSSHQPIVNMSEALVWEVMKKSSSKSIRRTHPVNTFTIEKGTLRHKRILRDSGLARVKAVDVNINDDGIPVLSMKNDTPDESRCPDKMWRTVTLNGGVRKALAKTDSLLSVYKPALKKPAMRKVSAAYMALARKNKGAAVTA